MTTLRRRKAVSVESLGGALPHPLPDCHLVRTAIPYLPLEDCLGDFHSITHRFYPLLQAWFQGAISPSSAATDASASLPYPDMSTQGRLHCTQQRDSAHCIAGSLLFRTQSGFFCKTGSAVAQEQVSTVIGSVGTCHCASPENLNPQHPP